MNLSKLVDEDEPLFISLIEDMFPGIRLSTQTYKDLQKGIANAAVALGIMNHAEWNLKTVQVRTICWDNLFIIHLTLRLILAYIIEIRNENWLNN